MSNDSLLPRFRALPALPWGKLFPPPLPRHPPLYFPGPSLPSVARDERCVWTWVPCVCVCHIGTNCEGNLSTRGFHLDAKSAVLNWYVAKENWPNRSDVHVCEGETGFAIVTVVCVSGVDRYSARQMTRWYLEKLQTSIRCTVLENCLLVYSAVLRHIRIDRPQEKKKSWVKRGRKRKPQRRRRRMASDPLFLFCETEIDGDEERQSHF